jgi:hypothetical protein
MRGITLDRSLADVSLGAEGKRYVRVRITAADLGRLKTLGGVDSDLKYTNSRIERSTGKELFQVDGEDVGVVPINISRRRAGMTNNLHHRSQAAKERSDTFHSDSKKTHFACT